MDFVNNAYRQATELFRSMTPAARVTTALLLVAVVVSLAYLFNHQTAGPDTFLFGGEPVAPSQLQAMEGAFGKANLTGYQVDGNRIRVPRGQHAAYMGALADAGAMPQNFGSFLQSTIDKGGPFVSKQKQAEMLKIATQSELAHILRSMKDIENASVLYDSQIESGPRGKKLITASVSIKPSGNAPLAEDRVPAIRHLVAGAIAGLSPENVAVTDLNSTRFYPTGPAGRGMGGFSEYSSTKSQFEKIWTDKIREALYYVPGVVVTTNVELNPETEHVESATVIDPKAVPIRSKETTRSTESQTAGAAGRPGVTAQNGIPSANSPLAVGAGGNSNKNEETDAEQVNEYGKKLTQTRRQGLIPEKVTVSVGVPSSYYEKIWHEQHPTPVGQPAKTPDPKELERIQQVQSIEIQKCVVQLVPPMAVAADVRPQVAVTTFQSITMPELPLPSVTDHALDWFGQYWSTLGMCCLGLVSLVMLRSMVKSAAAPAPAAAPNDSVFSITSPSEEESPAAVGSESVAASAGAGSARLKRRLRGGPTLRDELAEIVREDPDGAASILRSWIGSAS